MVRSSTARSPARDSRQQSCYLLPFGDARKFSRDKNFSNKLLVSSSRVEPSKLYLTGSTLPGDIFAQLAIPCTKN